MSQDVLSSSSENNDRNNHSSIADNKHSCAGGLLIPRKGLTVLGDATNRSSKGTTTGTAALLTENNNKNNELPKIGAAGASATCSNPLPAILNQRLLPILHTITQQQQPFSSSFFWEEEEISTKADDDITTLITGGEVVLPSCPTTQEVVSSTMTVQSTAAVQAHAASTVAAEEQPVTAAEDPAVKEKAKKKKKKNKEMILKEQEEGADDSTNYKTTTTSTTTASTSTTQHNHHHHRNKRSRSMPHRAVKRIATAAALLPIAVPVAEDKESNNNVENETNHNNGVHNKKDAAATARSRSRSKSVLRKGEEDKAKGKANENEKAKGNVKAKTKAKAKGQQPPVVTTLCTYSSCIADTVCYNMVLPFTLDVNKHMPGIAPHDTRSIGNVLAAPEYVTDIFQRLYQVEGAAHHHFDSSISIQHPVGMLRLTDRTHITPPMRAILFNWLVAVHRKFGLESASLHLTFSIVDRYLAVAKCRRQRFQLLGMAALLIASKYEDIFPPLVKDIVYTSDRAFVRQEVLEMEENVLSTLDFRISFPTAYPFLCRFLFLVHATPTAMHAANYYLERSMLDFTLCSRRPSLVAAAAVCLAINHPMIYRQKDNDGTAASSEPVVHPQQPGIPEILLTYTGFSLDTIVEVADHIANGLTSASYPPCHEKLDAVSKTYKHERYHKVATLDPPSTLQQYVSVAATEIATATTSSSSSSPRAVSHHTVPTTPIVTIV